jgi:predicted nucleotidyltransferase
VEKTSGIAPSLAQALEAFADRIDFAFIYGSFARGQEHASSDVDVMIAGVVEQIDLVPALRKLEDRLGREVNVTLYSPQEFRAKAAAGDHFLCSVLKNRTILLKGSRNELDSMVTRRKTSPAPDQRPGARRNPSSRGARSR